MVTSSRIKRIKRFTTVFIARPLSTNPSFSQHEQGLLVNLMLV